MDPAEYDNLAAVEAEHWYYSGKRSAVRHWLRATMPFGRDRVLLDCGAGTGRFAKEMEADCRVLVLDSHEESLRILRKQFTPEQVLSLAGDQVPLPDQSLDAITALDVLEHVPDDQAVVKGFHRLLRPGGTVVVTVPAGMALWSDWDVALHHYRRYNRAELRALFPDTAWELVHLNYTNVLVYPVVWLVRKWRARQAKKNPQATANRMEDRVPPAVVNTLLRWQFVTLAKVRWPLPFGVSLLAVARRK